MMESVLILSVLIGSWIVYELYGRSIVIWSWIRIACGIAVIIYVYFQTPAELKETLTFAQQVVSASSLSQKPTQTSAANKRNVSGLLKKKIAANQQWKCGLCGTVLDETYEVDHRIALYKGGTNNPDNLVALCPNCHRKKTVEEQLQN